MNRRDFVRNAALASMATHPVFSHIPFTASRHMDSYGAQQPAALSGELLADFSDLEKWMQANGWLAVIKKATNLDLDIRDPQNPDLFKELTINKTAVQGLDDFIGNKLIEPGSPARSRASSSPNRALSWSSSFISSPASGRMLPTCLANSRMRA